MESKWNNTLCLYRTGPWKVLEITTGFLPPEFPEKADLPLTTFMVSQPVESRTWVWFGSKMQY